MQNVQHLALTTFVFPDSSARSPQAPPQARDVAVPANCSAVPIPHTPNMLSPISHDSSLAFAVPYDQISEFLRATQEIPETIDTKDGSAEQKKWIMKAARSSGSGSRRVLRIWLTDAWNSFVDLLKVGMLLLSLRNNWMASRSTKIENMY